MCRDARLVRPLQLHNQRYFALAIKFHLPLGREKPSLAQRAFMALMRAAVSGWSEKALANAPDALCPDLLSKACIFSKASTIL